MCNKSLANRKNKQTNIGRITISLGTAEVKPHSSIIIIQVEDKTFLNK